MFFLLRTAFWLTLVLVLIPLGSDKSESETTQVDPISAYFAAQATVSDLGGFCGRNPQACETGGEALTAIGSRARDGARIVYEFLDTQIADDKGADAIALVQQMEGQDSSLISGLITGSTPGYTLNPQDVITPWQGHVQTLATETEIGPIPRPNPRLGSRP